METLKIVSSTKINFTKNVALSINLKEESVQGRGIAQW
jgi:hypothetical protein